MPGLIAVDGVQGDGILHARAATFEAWSTVCREGLGEAVRDVTQHPAALHIGEWPCACAACQKEEGAKQ